MKMKAVTKLMKNYYKYYAEGNVDKMKIATVSKLEAGLYQDVQRT